MNRCPKAGCSKTIGEDFVACRPHWFELPPALRNKIWQLYKREQGSDAHRAAVFEAVQILAKTVPA